MASVGIRVPVGAEGCSQEEGFASFSAHQGELLHPNKGCSKYWLAGGGGEANIKIFNRRWVWFPFMDPSIYYYDSPFNAAKQKLRKSSPGFLALIEFLKSKPIAGGRSLPSFTHQQVYFTFKGQFMALD